jgi:hypothetical protein
LSERERRERGARGRQRERDTRDRGVRRERIESIHFLVGREASKPIKRVFCTK